MTCCPIVVGGGPVVPGGPVAHGAITVGPPGSGADYESTGGADDSAVFSAAYAASVATGKRYVDVWGGRYRFLQGFAVNPFDEAGCAFVGRGVGVTTLVFSLGFDDVNNDGLIVTTPASNPDPVPRLVQASVFSGDTWILMPPGTPVSAIYPRDTYALLSSDDPFNATINPSRLRGEIIKVNKIGIDVQTTGQVTAHNAVTLISTLSVAAGTFSAADVGKAILIEADPNDANNGAFTVLTVSGPGDQIDYFNRESGAAASVPGVDVLGPIIAIFGMARDAYYTTSSARITTIPWVRNIRISDLSFAQEAPLGARVGGAAACIALKFCQGFMVERLGFRDLESPGVTVQTSILGNGGYGFRAQNFFDQALAQDFGYVSLVGDASEGIVWHGQITDVCRHSFDTGRHKFTAQALNGDALPDAQGVPRHVMCSTSITMRATDAAFSTHEQGDAVIFANIHAGNSDSIAIVNRAQKTQVFGLSMAYVTGGATLGTAAGSSPQYGGSNTTIMGMVANDVRLIKSGAADLENTGFTGSRGGSGGGNGLTTSQNDGSVVLGLVGQRVDRALVRARSQTTNLYVQDPLSFECNADQSGGSTSSAFVLEQAANGSATIQNVAGLNAELVAVTGTFNAAMVGRDVFMAGFANPQNNQVIVIIGFVSSTLVSIAFPGGVPANQAGGTWDLEGASWCAIINARAVQRPIHPDGLHGSFYGDARDEFGAPRRAVLIDGFQRGNIITVAEGYGMFSGVADDTSVGLPANIIARSSGSSDALQIPTFATVPTDNDYQRNNLGLTGGGANVSAFDVVTGLVTITRTGGDPWPRTLVGRTLDLNTFPTFSNSLKAAVRVWIDASNVQIWNPIAVVEAGGQWDFVRVGVQDGAVSIDTTTQQLYYRDGSPTHTPLFAEAAFLDEDVVPFQSGVVLQPAIAASAYANLDTAAPIVEQADVWFDASKYPATTGLLSRQIYLDVLLSVSIAAIIGTPEIRLFDPVAVSSINGTTIAHNTTTPTLYSTAALAVGAGANQIKLALTQYVIQGRHNTGVPTSLIRCHWARFRVEYT